MKRKTKIFLSCMMIFIIMSCMVLPCFGVVADIEDTLAGDVVYYSANEDYSQLTRHITKTFKQGETYEEVRSYLDAPSGRYPNYFLNEFHIYSSTGLPLFEANKSYRMNIMNFYNMISHEEDGYGYLDIVDSIMINFWYTDGSTSGFSEFKDAIYDMNYRTYTSFVSFDCKPKKEVASIYVRLYYDMLDFGWDYIADDGNEMEYLLYYLGTKDFKITRDDIFPEANSAPIDDYANEEKKLIDATSGGISEITSLTNNLTQVFVPESSIYRGTMFFGNFMADIVGTIPDFNMIVLVSLSIGIVTIIIGFGAEVAGRSIGRANSEMRSEARYQRRKAERAAERRRRKKGG